MDSQQILSRVAEIVTNISGNVTPVDSDVKLADCGLDSLDAVSVVLDCEEAFSIHVPDEVLDSTNLETLGSIAKLVESCCHDQNAA